MVYLFVLLACICMASGLFVLAWKTVEYVLNGVVSGTRLFCVGVWRLSAASWRLSRWALRHASRIELRASQAAYAWAYGAGYRLRRRYIAGQLKHIRRARHAH